MEVFDEKTMKITTSDSSGQMKTTHIDLVDWRGMFDALGKISEKRAGTSMVCEEIKSILQRARVKPLGLLELQTIKNKLRQIS